MSDPDVDPSARHAVGVIGLGAMGGRAAAALVSAGHPVTGYDPVSAAVSAAGNAGVNVVETPSAAVPAGGLVLLSLPMPDDVLSVAAALGDDLGGVLVADLSTVDPQTNRAAAGLVADRGGAYVDAPILGRPDAVGKWTLVCGGDPADVERLRSVAERAFAKAVHAVGDTVGSGSVVKLLNNMMFGAINAATAEAMDLAAASGVDPARFVEIVSDSGAATVSPLFRDIAPRMASGEYDPAFRVALLAKDVRLGRQLAETANRSVPVATVVERLTTAAADGGLADADTAAVLEVYRRADGRP